MCPDKIREIYLVINMPLNATMLPVIDINIQLLVKRIYAIFCALKLRTRLMRSRKAYQEYSLDKQKKY